jgi:membrane protein YqaA with SNARE-associated domain
MHDAVLWIQRVLIPTLGLPGLFFVAFLDSSFLSIPEINDILVVTSSTVNPGTAWLAALMATLGSLAGCLVLWELGRRGGERFLERRFGTQKVEKARAAFRRWDILALAVPAVLPPPMPFKIFVLSAGVFGLPLRRFATTVALARGLRYSVWGALGALWGQHATVWLRAADGFFAEQSRLLLWLLGAGLLLACLWFLWRRSGSPGTPPV